MKTFLLILISALIIFGAASKKSAKNPDTIPENKL
jgi:hypothetical protein